MDDDVSEVAEEPHLGAVDQLTDHLITECELPPTVSDRVESRVPEGVTDLELQVVAGVSVRRCDSLPRELPCGARIEEVLVKSEE